MAMWNAQWGVPVIKIAINIILTAMLSMRLNKGSRAQRWVTPVIRAPQQWSNHTLLVHKTMHTRTIIHLLSVQRISISPLGLSYTCTDGGWHNSPILITISNWARRVPSVVFILTTILILFHNPRLVKFHCKIPTYKYLPINYVCTPYPTSYIPVCNYPKC